MDFSQTHFELFGLPQSYALDRDKLDAAYRELQNTVHPDRFAAQPAAEQRVAMQGAALDALPHDLRAAHPGIEAQLAELIDTAHDFSAASEAVRQLRFMDKLIAEIGDAYEE